MGSCLVIGRRIIIWLFRLFLYNPNRGLGLESTEFQKHLDLGCKKTICIADPAPSLRNAEKRPSFLVNTCRPSLGREGWHPAVQTWAKDLGRMTKQAAFLVPGRPCLLLIPFWLQWRFKRLRSSSRGRLVETWLWGTLFLSFFCKACFLLLVPSPLCLCMALGVKCKARVTQHFLCFRPDWVRPTDDKGAGVWGRCRRGSAAFKVTLLPSVDLWAELPQQEVWFACFSFLCTLPFQGLFSQFYPLGKRELRKQK